MMADSVFALVQDRDRHGDHLPLRQGQVTVPVHQPLVKQHHRPQRRHIQAVRLDDMVHTAPGSFCAVIDLRQRACGFVFVYCFYPGHFVSVSVDASIGCIMAAYP